MKKLEIFISLMILTMCAYAQSWKTVGYGSNSLNGNGLIYSIALDGDGNIYAAGYAKDTSNNYWTISKWNGHYWNEIGTTSLRANSPIYTLATDGLGNVYAGGGFSDSTTGTFYVAKWDGSSWSPLGTGNNTLQANDQINTLALDKSSNVYAAGKFTDANGYYYVAKWNGANWSSLGNGSNALNANGAINTLAVDSIGNVYAAGEFTDTNGSAFVSKWNGSYWTKLPTNFYSLEILSVVADKAGNLYAGGALRDSVSGKYCVGIWNGNHWAELGKDSNSLNANDEIKTLAVDKSGNVYASGNFTDSNGNQYVAKWNGKKWTELGTGNSALSANNEVISIAVDGNYNIYAAGKFLDSNYEYQVMEYNASLSAVPNLAISNSNIRIYPNPSTGWVQIDHLTTETQLDIVDILGTKIQSITINNSSSNLDLNHLSAGIYSFLLSDKTATYYPVKWLKQ